MPSTCRWVGQWNQYSGLGGLGKVSMERKFPLFVFGSTFFFSYFLLSLSRNYLCLEGFEIILQPGIGHWWTLQQFWSCHQQRTEWGVEPRIIQANPTSLGFFSRIQKPVQNHRWNFGVKKLQIYNSSILSWISSCIWIFQPQVVSENPKRHCRLRPPLTLDPSSLETEIRLATRKHELKSELMEMFARFGMDYWWIVDEFMIHVPVF